MFVMAVTLRRESTRARVDLGSAAREPSRTKNGIGSYRSEAGQRGGAPPPFIFVPAGDGARNYNEGHG